MQYTIVNLFDLINEADTEELQNNLNDYLQSFSWKKY